MSTQSPSSSSTRPSASLFALGTMSAGFILGAVLMVVAYHAAATDHSSAAFALFWVAMFTALLPVIVTVLSTRPLNAGVRVGGILMFGLWGSLPKLLRSWGDMVYSDEFAHFRVVHNIIQSGTYDPSVPNVAMAPEYPGLHSATAALSMFSTIPAFWVGTAIVVVAHMLVAVGVYRLVREIGASERAGTISALIYTFNPSWLLFDVQFAYESVALPLLVWSFVLVVRAGRLRSTAALVGALIVLTTLAITHHLTGITAVALLAGYAVVSTIRKANRIEGAQEWLPALWVGAAWAAFTSIGWMIASWSEITSYLSPSLRGPFSQLQNYFSGDDVAGGRAPFGGSTLPVYEQVAGLALPFVLLAVYVLSVRILVHSRRQLPSVVLFAALMGATWFVSVPFVLTSSGAEGARRTWAVTYIGIAVLAGLAAEIRMPDSVRRVVHNMGRPRVGVAMGVIAALLAMGGIAVGTTAATRFPGPAEVGNDARSLTGETDQLGDWFSAHRPTGTVFADRYVRGVIANAADVQIAKTGQKDKALRSITLTDTPISPALITTIREEKVSHIVVDTRMSSVKPEMGFWYDRNEAGAGKLIPARVMHRLGCLPWLQAVYSTPNYRVYEIHWDAFTMEGTRQAENVAFEGGTCE